MSLFEKLKNKRLSLHEVKDDTKGRRKNIKTSSKKGISDSEINKRLSASTTKGDQARSQYGADGGYGDSNVGDTTTNKSLKKGKPFTKAQSDAIQSKSTLNKSKKYASGEYPKIGGGERMSPKSKGLGASTGGQKNRVVNPKSKGTTPVTISKTKTVKQSEVSKKASEFTAKVNKRRIERGTKKAERIKDATGGKKTGSLRKGNLSFAGDRSGEYKRVKTDIQTKNLLKKAGGSGDIGFSAPDRKTKVAKRTTRAIKQGTPDPFTTPKPKKPIAPFGTKKVTTSAPEFGKGDTKGQMNVKAMNKKSFKVTQPKDVKLPKSFTDFSKKIKKYRVDREIEKKINQPSYQIKSKGSGASTGGSTNYSSTSSRTGSMKGGSKPKNGSSSTGGGGGKPPKTPPKTPPSTPPSGGGKGIDPEIVQGKFKKKKIKKGRKPFKITFGKGPDYVPPKAAKVGLGKKVLKYAGKLRNPKVAVPAALGALAVAGIANRFGPKPEGKKKDTLTDKDFKLATKTGIVKKDGSQVRRNLNFGKKVKNKTSQETTSSISKKLGKKEYRVK